MQEVAAIGRITGYCALAGCADSLKTTTVDLPRLMENPVGELKDGPSGVTFKIMWAQHRFW
jgi:hypothetical protein